MTTNICCYPITLELLIVTCSSITQDQTKTVRFTLAGYLTESMEKKTAGYKCEMSITVDVTRYSSVVGKTFPVCKMFIPTFGGSFLNPCESYLGNYFETLHKLIISSQITILHIIIYLKNLLTISLLKHFYHQRLVGSMNW